MDEKIIIENLIKSKPKHYVRLIQRNSELWAWVQQHSTAQNTAPAAQIYSAITGTSDVCANGKQKTFKSVQDGWRGCGKAKTCMCVAHAVSVAVSATKQAATEEEKQIINDRRKATNLARYGVENSGQTQTAREAHQAFYDDAHKVAAQIAQQTTTMLSRHGVANAAHLDSVVEKKKATNLARYGVENPMQNADIAKKSGRTRADIWDPEAIRSLNFKKFVRKCQDDWNVVPLIAEEDYCGMYPLPKMTFQCLECGHTEERKMDYGRVPICKICNPPEVKYESQEEVEVREYIKTIYDGAIRIRDRSIINPYELDIVLPDLGIAIEYCGLYWHSELAGGKKWNYHEKKMKIANAAGLRLITIFSDEWLLKKDIVKSKLRALVQKDQNSIGARQCTVKEITRSHAKGFHDQYHIQGSPRRLKTNIGLFYNDMLVAVGSFNTTRNEVLLSRFSSSRQVIGGCSKILSHYLKNHPCNAIVSFADLRWSTGRMYNRMGFTECGRVPPMQEYVGSGYTRRFNKRSLSKHKINITDQSLTEWQAVQELGYDRIWDCGKIKFRLDVSKNQEKIESPVDLFEW